MQKDLQTIHNEISSILQGKSQAVNLAMACLIAEGHLLIEDLPGVGKTTLAKALAKSFGVDYTRIQFTADVLPQDIIGFEYLDSNTGNFVFKKGPLFSEFILADELNRASPRTQSAFLQAMEEGQVAVDGKSHSLPQPFFVIATQNPSSQQGTFPLPESQIDRFMMAISLGLAEKEIEIRLFMSSQQGANLGGAISNKETLLRLQRASRQITLSRPVAEYIQQLLSESRRRGHELSTRAGMHLAKATRAWALMQERDYCMPEDVQAVATAVLSHRIGAQKGLKNGTGQFSEILQSVPVAL